MDIRDFVGFASSWFTVKPHRMGLQSFFFPLRYVACMPTLHFKMCPVACNKYNKAIASGRADTWWKRTFGGNGHLVEVDSWWKWKTDTWWKRTFGGSGHLVEADIWWKRTLGGTDTWWKRTVGGNGHLVETDIWWKRTVGGNGHLVETDI